MTDAESDQWALTHHEARAKNGAHVSRKAATRLPFWHVTVQATSWKTATMKPFLRATTSFAFVLACFTAQAQPQPGSLDVHWNEGALDCTHNPQPPLQVHRYNANMVVLRQNPCATYEAPFL
jgi:hypothetical protein